MRKTILFLLLLLPLGVFAKLYDHSLGFVGGNFNGISYKTLATEHFAVQTDLGVEITVFDNVYGLFKVQPMFMYQGSMYSNSICSIDWFLGAGPSLGFMTKNLRSSGSFGGEFTLNAIAGIECAFSRAVAISLDFRPGYGMFYGDNAITRSSTYYYWNSYYKYYEYYTSYYTDYEFSVDHFFDWGVQLGMRFYL